MATESLRIVITVNGDRVARKKIASVGQEAKKTESAIDLMKRSMQALGGAFLVRELGGMLDSMTNIRNRVSLFTDDADQATVVLEQLAGVANKTRTSFEATAKVYSRMAIATADLGKSQAELIHFQELLNKATIISGARTQEANAAMIQLSQGLAAGALRGDELRSVLEQLPYVASIIAEGMGITRGELKRLGEQGLLTSEAIFKSFEKLEGSINQKFAKTVPTMAQSWEIFRNNVMLFLDDLNQSVAITEKVSRALKFLGENIEDVARVLVILTFKKTMAFSVGLIYRATAAVLLFGRALLLTPVGLIATAVGAMVAFSKKINVAKEGFISLRDAAVAFAKRFKKEVIDRIGGVFKELYYDAQSFFDAVKKGFKDVFGEIEISVPNVIGGLLVGIDAIVKGILMLAVVVGETIIYLFDKMVKEATKRAKQVWDIIPGKGLLGGGIDLDDDNIRKSLGAEKKKATPEDTYTGRLLKATAQVEELLGDGLAGMFAETLTQDLKPKTWNLWKEMLDQMKLAWKGTKKAIPPPPNKKWENFIKGVRKEVDELENELYPLLGAQKEELDVLQLLTAAEKLHIISGERGAEMMNRYREAHLAELDPLTAVTDKLDEETKLLGMNEKAREKEKFMLGVIADMRGILTEEQVRNNEELKESIRRNTEAKDLDAERTRLLQLKAEAVTMVSGAEKQYKDIVTGLAEAYKDGSINFVEYLKGLKMAEEAYVEATLAAGSYEEWLYNLNKEASNFDGARMLGEQFASFGEQFIDTLVDMEFAFGKLIKSMIQDITKLFLKQLFYKAVLSALGTPTIPLPGFQSGGSFTVPSTRGGGPDSEVVAFRASPGETVTVAPQGQVGQQGSSTASPEFNVRVVNQVDPNEALYAMSTPAGERVIVNAIRRRASEVRKWVR